MDFGFDIFYLILKNKFNYYISWLFIYGNCVFKNRIFFFYNIKMFYKFIKVLYNF